ncbi:phosphatidylinositol-binding protein scs2 [Apophysomyces ossiformis]|uniref:Phosphatidylinositol-binding protein scs2 n=1 Tax=Apophysomyces ossiformis TaxID=679940 RepID=A0A8H7BRV9_9FUNG|nr:phosphatidylinositol-binding protein scs2 [Apophysomyces ossiformis]
MASVLQPSDQLTFYRPFDEHTQEILIVKNPGAEHLAFKIKTTAPKQYCVRPNAGRIEPHSEVQVQIILQPFKNPLPEDYKCKDKFLVQTAAIKPTYPDLAVGDLWTYIDTEDKRSVQQHKLRCVFMPPKTSAAAPVAEASNILHGIARRKGRWAPVVEMVETIEATQTTPELVAAVSEQSPTIVQQEEETNEIKKKLSEAHATIGQLQRQLEQTQNNLRMRQNATQSVANNLSRTVQPSDAVHQHLTDLEKPQATEGYPPQIVLLVAVLVFIITYLFF